MQLNLSTLKKRTNYFLFTLQGSSVTETLECNLEHACSQASMLTFLQSQSRREKTAENLAQRLKKTQLVRHGIQEALTFSFTQRSVFIFLLAVQSKTPGWCFQIGKHFEKLCFHCTRLPDLCGWQVKYQKLMLLLRQFTFIYFLVI